jgi:IclR family acetate operon transcriptional repressor
VDASKQAAGPAIVQAMRAPDGPVYPIESVERALTLILGFEHTDTIRISEAGRLLGVSRSTAYRLLSLLEHHEFVQQDSQSKAFHPGPALLRVGLAAVHRSDLRSALRPLVQTIVNEVDETAHMVVLQRDQAFFLDCVEGSKMIRATSRVGTVLPAHVTASGKVLLASLTDGQLDDLLPEHLPAVTKRSKVSRGSVRRELAKVRRRGWASNDGESEDLLRAVAVRVPGSPGRGGIDAAITVAGPAQRLDESAVQRIVGVLQSRVAEFLATETS